MLKKCQNASGKNFHQRGNKFFFFLTCFFLFFFLSLVCAHQTILSFRPEFTTVILYVSRVDAGGGVWSRFILWQRNSPEKCQVQAFHEPDFLSWLEEGIIRKRKRISKLLQFFCSCCHWGDLSVMFCHHMSHYPIYTLSRNFICREKLSKGGHCHSLQECR